jgi:DNA-binding transcriptional LysR family regulator
MELRNLKTFQVVAEELNMTKAAKQLNYTQPTITLQIQSLERELNHKLLARVGKETFLTEAGKKLKVHVDNLLAHVEEIQKDMQEIHGPAGTLTIAASEYYCTRHLSLLLKTYTEMYPKVRLNLLPLNSVHAIQSIKDHVADIAIIASECNEIDIRKNFLEEEQTLLVASSEISKGKLLKDILFDFPFLSYNDDCSFSHIIDQYFKEIDTQPQSTIVCGGSDETIKRAVIYGTGYAILGENVIKNELNDGSITILQQISEPIITSSIYLESRSEEFNIQIFNELLQNTWSLVEN